MSANLDALVNGIRNKRKEKLPQAKARLEKLKAAKDAVLTTRTRAAAVAANNSDLQAKLGGVRYEAALQLLETAIGAADRAVKRLSRESINIGVAGMARQGKSQILQMLTGLGDEQIPTGDGGFCTAARSVVTNGSARSAVVYFMSEEDLMAKKVRPAYAPVNSREGALGLSPMPASLQTFLSQPVPKLHDNPLPSELFYWGVLKQFHQTLVSDPSLVGRIGSAPMTVPLSEVRRYVAKDTGATDSEVVDHVEIVTPFSVDLPSGMVVFDLPGLGEMSPIIRATMLQTISEETDIVLLMRKPSNSGDGWQEKDFELMNMLKKVYPDGRIKPCDWVQVVLNHDRRPSHDNTRNVDLMLQSAPADIAPVKCDCGSQDAVREMINVNMDRLVQMTACIDDFRIAEADASFNSAMGEVRALYDALRNASGDILARESGFDFERHLLSFMYGLRDPFKKDIAPVFRNSVREILARHFKEAEAMLGQIYDANESAEDFPQELPVFSRTRLKQEFGAGNGPDGVVEKTVRNQREAVLKLLRDHLAKCCDELVACYYDCVVKTGFASNPSLNCISSVGDGSSSSYARLEQFLVAVRASGSFPSIESALEGVLRLELTFDNSILPALYSISELDDFNPDLPPEAKKEGSHELDDIKAYLRNDIHDSADRATAFCNWLRQKSESILSCVTSGSASSPLFQISEHIANTMRANYDAFVFRFIWGEMTTNEWRRLADRNKAIFWKEEFDKAAANSQIAKDWQSAIAGLASAL